MSSFLILLLTGLSPLLLSGAVRSETVPFTDVNEWRRNFQAYCSFPCPEVIRAGDLTVTINLSMSTSYFSTYNNMILLSTDGNNYVVKNKFDMWPNTGQCKFNFHVKYNSNKGAITGSCSRPGEGTPTSSSAGTSSTTPTPTTTATSTAATMSTTTGVVVSDGSLVPLNNYRHGDVYRFQGLCKVPCDGSKAPGDLTVTITLDKQTVNFDAYGNFEPVPASTSPTSIWNVVNSNHMHPQSNGKCEFSFQVEHSPENPVPSGTCAVGSTTSPPTQSTTQTPSSSTQAPSSSTQTPSSSTQAPSSSTQTSSSTTQTPSSSSTQASSSTTQRVSSTTNSGNAKYPYSEVLTKSILFYAAQRSGPLPAYGPLPQGNPISWRSDSTLTDGQDVGVDLTGGWFDAGDNVKFNFPMASSTTVLAWGLTLFKDAYSRAGELENMYDCIKWPLDYFLKCWDGGNQVFYGQVGDGHADHAVWDRPEDITMARPTYELSTSKPGSDLAGETAAALAAGYMAFKDKDSAYAATLLTAAKQLYDFARNNQGIYSDSITNAQTFYNSWSGFQDELFYGAAMLYLATGEDEYKSYAEQFEDLTVAGEFSWDDKRVGAQLAMYQATKLNKYKTPVQSFVNNYITGNGVQRTPKGLAWLRQWGPLRYAANAAFIAVAAAESGIQRQAFVDFAESQINYALGSTGRSYVVGFGVNPPVRPHHRSSSCPALTVACDWSYYRRDAANPHVLYGALVGGPDASDQYTDDRTDYIQNEVATDYNAGFQSAVAGLKHFLG